MFDKLRMTNHGLRTLSRESTLKNSWLEKLDVASLDDTLWVLYIFFVCLNFLDIFSTSLALGNQISFQENNILAARLFAMSTQGFLLAILLKFASTFPLFFIIFLKDQRNKYSFQVKIVKVSALFALVVGVIFYVAVVFLNNIPLLVSRCSKFALIIIIWLMSSLHTDSHRSVRF